MSSQKYPKQDEYIVPLSVVSVKAPMITFFIYMYIYWLYTFFKIYIVF